MNRNLAEKQIAQASYIEPAQVQGIMENDTEAAEFDGNIIVIEDIGINTFAYGLCYTKMFWIFLIGSFGGVVIETILCLVNNHVLQNRAGVIYGPFNPIYGAGAVLMTTLLYKVSKKGDMGVFIGGALIGGAFEYLCSFLQECTFGTVSWDYSYMPLNINGRTNILYMAFWGVLGLIWMKRIYPMLSSLIEKTPAKWGVALTWVLTIFIIADMSVSALAVGRQAQRREGIPASSSFEHFLDDQYPDSMLEDIYPSMKPVEKQDKQPD